jgi:hypothetical protein
VVQSAAFDVKITQGVSLRAALLKRLITVLLFGMVLSDRASSDSTLHIVISEGEFADHLGIKGKIARVVPGKTMRISFQYSEYSRLHPYLIADQFCGDNRFMRWGNAAHPSLGDIELVCVRGKKTRLLRNLMAGS